MLSKIYSISLLIIIVIIGCSEDNTTESNPSINANNNIKPIITSAPTSKIDHNREYTYQIMTNDPDGDNLTISTSLPGWLSFDRSTKTISGTAGWDNITSFDISISVSDGKETTEQNYNLTVNLGEIICNQDFGDPEKSQYILPYAKGNSYRIIQSYCPSNPAWGHHNWFAYDFDMQIGDTIIAMREGQVIATQGRFVDANRKCGEENFVFILHDDGTVASYIHLTQNGPLVSAGQRVVQGQSIGISGDTGCSIGPHLHIAVFRNRNNFGRQSSLPINFSNAGGTLDNNKGLVQNGIYKAL